MPVATTQTRPVPSRRSRGHGRNRERLARGALLLAGLLLLWAAEHAFTAFGVHQRTTFEWSVTRWLSWVVLAVAAGVAVGFAAWLPARRRYRWKRVLALAAVPALMMVHMVLKFGILPTSFTEHQSIVTADYWYLDPDAGPQFALAALLGVIIASGFASERTPPVDERDSAVGAESFD